MKYLSFSCFLVILFLIGCSKDDPSLNTLEDSSLLIENINALAFDQDLEELLSDAFAVDDSSTKTVYSVIQRFY